MPGDGNVCGSDRSPRMIAVRQQHTSGKCRLLMEASRRRYDGPGLIGSGTLATTPLPGRERDVSLQGCLIAVLARRQEGTCIPILDE